MKLLSVLILSLSVTSAFSSDFTCTAWTATTDEKGLVTSEEKILPVQSDIRRQASIRDLIFNVKTISSLGLSIGSDEERISFTSIDVPMPSEEYSPELTVVAADGRVAKLTCAVAPI